MKLSPTQALPLDTAQTIVDVGGADGAVLAAILAAHRETSAACCLIFLTSSPMHPGIFARHGVADRVDCIGGDFFESVPPGADAYLASLVLHDWPDQQAQRILANIAEAGGSGARLLVLDFVVPLGDTPHMAKVSDLNMLGMMGGKERTANRIPAAVLPAAAGFTGTGVHNTDTPFSVIQATVK